jgi:pimeloyl-ACP methyl ester carboxylesterase
LPTLFRLTALLCLSALPAAAQDRLDDRLDALGAVPCEDTTLTGVTLPMPHDHTGREQGAPIPVTFAVHTAPGQSQGILFYNLGGPGYAALPWGDSYISSLDLELTSNFDIVFHDQRGVGSVHGIACPDAELAFTLAPLDPVADPVATIAAAQTFVDACTAEADSPLLNVVSTEQAAHDLEIFRQAIGAPPVWVYGESYGTQLAQTYATLYPEAIAGVILDGVVDLALSLEGFYATYTIEAVGLLERVFTACAATPACASDFGDSPSAAYDRLAAELLLSDQTVYLGENEHVLTLGMLQNTAFYALYSPAGRTEFLRALAAAHRGNPVPLLRLSYANFGIDITTGVSTPDPDWYGGAYFAITCSDYAEPGATAADRAANVIAEATAFITDSDHAGNLLSRLYFAERLACALWPAQGPVDRPAQFAGGDWPTLVLTSDADPITPSVMAYAVADSAANAAIVVMEGGPHVILGWGLGCPDQIVTDLMLDGTMPAAPTQICRQDLLTLYDPLTLTGDVTPLAIGRAVETEYWLNPTFYVWDYITPLTTGCDHGGTVTLTAGSRGTEFRFGACAFWPEVILTGKGLLAENGTPTDGLSLQVDVMGLNSGRLTYVRNALTEAAWISGTWNGAEVTIPRP